LYAKRWRISLGYRYYAYLRKNTHDQISANNRLIIFIGAAFGAFLGSHVVGVLENPTLLSHFNLIYFMGNKTIVGGMLGGLIGVELTKKRIGVTVSSGDLMVYPLILAMIIGRTGCFLAGLEDGTYGIASNLPWAINFGDGIRRHPTNLYEIVFG
jgi:phosphatidylglycerol:prolipoprotein diacylglycerol transferase